LGPIVETLHLTKSFRKFTAVHDLSFTINRGEIYGLLGQNGAGKSTVMRMLTGLIYPTSGTIKINGTPFGNHNRHLLDRTSAIIERPDMYGYLTGWENLTTFSAFNATRPTRQRLLEVLEIVGLSGREQDKVKTYSMGMKQRLAIAISLVSKPDLLILDEPTNGLDPQGIADMRRLILSLNKDHGTTILISSHLLFEIQQVATHMIVLHKGHKMVEGALNELLNPNDTFTEINTGNDAALPAQLAQSQWQPLVHRVAPGLLIMKMNPGRIADLNNWLVQSGIQVFGINTQHSLEAYFLTLTDAPATQNGTV